MILLKNPTLLSWDPPAIQEGKSVLIEGGVIKSLLSAGEIPEEAKMGEIIDCTGKYLAPGLACSHNHFYSALSRGVMARIKPSTDFVSQLKNLWWRLDRAIDAPILQSSALVGALEAIKAGTTSVIDHHSSPNYILGSLSVIRQAFLKTGLRGILCYETTDRNGRKGMLEGVKENIDFVSIVEKDPQELRLVEASLGGHAPNTLGDEALRLLSQGVKDTGRGLHIHVGEDRYDSSHSHAMYGKDIMERLSSYELLTDKGILVHGVHLTKRDREIINEQDSFLIHNCRSNMNNTVGYQTHLSDFKNCALGTDGIGSDMWKELQFAFFKHRDSGGNLWPSDFLKFLHQGNRLLSRYFKRDFGRLQEGSAADLILLDYKSPTPLLADNLPGHMAFGFSAQDVETVIINGRIVYRERSFPQDLQPLYREARIQASRLWDRMDKLSD